MTSEGAVEVARSDAEHDHGRHLRQRAAKAFASSLRPPAASQKTGFDQEEVRNADVPSVDAVSGSVSPHRTECANYRSRSSTMTPGVIMMSGVRGPASLAW